MKLIKPYAEVWEQGLGILGIYKQIEKCARVCYKSEDRTGEGTAEKMVEMLKKNEHTAMLEHGTIYLKIVWDTDLSKVAEKYIYNRYSKVVRLINEADLCPIYYIATNYRVLVENNWLEDLKYLCEPTEHHEKRITAHFVCDRGVSHELVRHRVFSFAQESTRYCNYSKDKFNKEITFILPPWVDERQLGEQNSEELLIQMGNLNNPAYTQTDLIELYFLFGLASSEIQYFNLLKEGWLPQQARAVLPNALKTEVCMTGFISDWKHFFNLRCDKAAHPQMRELAIPLKEEFIKRDYLDE